MGLKETVYSTWDDLTGMNPRQLLLQGVNLGNDNPLMLTELPVISKRKELEALIVDAWDGQIKSDWVERFICRVNNHICAYDMEDAYSHNWIRISRKQLLLE